MTGSTDQRKKGSGAYRRALFIQTNKKDGEKLASLVR